MRLLFVSNLYPPANLGGMELRCQEVVQGLEALGHACTVLTSDFAPEGVVIPAQPNVRRTLALESDVYHYRPMEHLTQYAGRLRGNEAALRAAAADARPDLAFFWGMWNLSPALIAAARKIFPGRVVQSFAGYWPIEPDAHEQYWRANDGDRKGQIFRRTLASLALSRRYRPAHWPEITFDHAIFCSRFVEERLVAGGVSFPHARVIFSGIDTDQFRPAGDPGQRQADIMRVLFAGGLTHHKGAHTVIEALLALPGDGRLAGQGKRQISLTLVGRGHAEYENILQGMAAHPALKGRVSFRPAVPRAEMPAVLREHDVFVLPTLTEEPLSRAVMEGMSSGLAVVASDSGGTPEMITHGADGLLFPPGDCAALAEHLGRLAEDPGLRVCLGQAARQTALARFDIRRMICEIEAFLEESLAQANAAGQTVTPGSH
jgi:glycosyltransferase involved in cell wall biosynthesis